jgi:hypothetical protein
LENPDSKEQAIVSIRCPGLETPRVNIQEKNGKAKVYQVKQVLDAIERIEELENG